MKYSFDRALCALYPNVAWSMVNTDDITTLKVINPPDAQVDISALESWITAKNAEEPMRLLRIERNKRLADCDWVAIKAFTQGTTISTEWATYLQALRDLPQNSTPSLLPNGQLDMTSVTFPTKPE
jgi:Phage tail assembly chaperone protein